MISSRSFGPIRERLFERYLLGHGIPFDHEPAVDESAKRIDLVIPYAVAGFVRVEVKTIWSPSMGVSVYDPYALIRSHIEEAPKKFSKITDGIDIIALVAFPGSFVDLTTPPLMLGAINGNYGFTLPFDMTTGAADPTKIQPAFIPGEGLMIRSAGTVRNAH